MDLHAQRALDELERARKAVGLAAAESHLALAELHLTEMRSIGEEPPPDLRLVSDEEPLAPGVESGLRLVSGE